MISKARKSEERKRNLTILYCVDDQREMVLLGMKKRGFGEGKYNGFGGKQEEDESIEDTARRELKEECTLIAKEIEPMGILYFEFDSKTTEEDKMLKDKPLLVVHLFICKDFEGEPVETDEMRPKWFGFNEIPLKNMWKGDKFWLEYVVKERRKLNAYFLFKGFETIVEKEIEFI